MPGGALPAQLPTGAQDSVERIRSNVATDQGLPVPDTGAQQAAAADPAAAAAAPEEPVCCYIPTESVCGFLIQRVQPRMLVAI